jgi:hypothetical protein
MTHVQSQSTSFQGHTPTMLKTHPGRSSSSLDDTILLACVQACIDCAQSCTACADACLGEEDPKAMRACIRLDLDCAAICEAAGDVLSRQTAFDAEMARAILEACATACGICATECEKHAARMEHCRVCAEACRQCEASCELFLESAGAPS